MKTTRYVISFDIGDKRFYFVDKNKFNLYVNEAYLFKNTRSPLSQFDSIFNSINRANDPNQRYDYLYEFELGGIKYTLKDATNVRIRKVSVVVKLEETEE